MHAHILLSGLDDRMHALWQTPFRLCIAALPTHQKQVAAAIANVGIPLGTLLGLCRKCDGVVAVKSADDCGNAGVANHWHGPVMPPAQQQMVPVDHVLATERACMT